MSEDTFEEIKKRIDESWKDATEKERCLSETKGEEDREATFSLFISGLMMEALIALGEVDNPLTKKKELNQQHAKFIVDTLGCLREKTKNNLTKNEFEMLDSILYDLRMRYITKTKT